MICRITSFASVALLSAVFLSACSGSKTAAGGGEGKKKGGGANEKVPVVVDKVQRKAVPLAIDAIGAVESVRSVAIKSLVTGSVWKVGFQEGSDVRKGDLLFEIDPRPFRIALSSAEADLEKTHAQLETAEEEVKRYSGLHTQGMVSLEQYRALENSAKILRAQTLSNRAAIENAKLQLEYCVIRAPCDGRTGSLNVHEGDLVRASDANVFLVTITQLSPIYVTFAIPQQNLADLQRYRSAGKIVVEAKGISDSKEKGELTFMDNAVDPGTGTIKLKATFINEDHGLWPSQFVPVRATLALVPDQIVVPSTAVQNGQRGTQAFIIRENGTAELRPVSVARAFEGESIIAKGLNEGETVVVDGQIRLRPDSLVEIKPPVVDVPSIRTGGGKKSAAGQSDEGKAGKT